MPASASSTRSASADSRIAKPAISCTGPSCRSPAIRRLFAFGRVERALQQPFSLSLARSHPPHQDPGDGHHQQHQRQQGGHQDRQERRGQLPSAIGDARGQLIGLEQQRRAVTFRVGVDPRVHLEELTEIALEAVLRLAQVRDVGHHTAMVDHVELVLAEVVGGADQLGLIRIDDRAVARPDLHAHDRVHLHRAEHHGGHGAEGLRVAGQEPLGHAALDQSRGNVGELLRLPPAPARSQPGEPPTPR